MKKVILLFSLLWMSSSVQAHGFDYSVIRLTEKANHQWHLNITASLEAFRKEVRLHFADTPYTTPEAFNEQLLAHVASTLTISAKDKKIALDGGKVTLGHETTITFEAIELPDNASTITLVNGAVKDIYRHTTKLIVAGLGEPKQSYILNKSNDFKARFSVQ